MTSPNGNLGIVQASEGERPSVAFVRRRRLSAAQRARVEKAVGHVVAQLVDVVLEALDGENDSAEHRAVTTTRQPQKITDLHKAKVDRILRRLGR